MNMDSLKKLEGDILKYVSVNMEASQRRIADELGCSLGAVNKSCQRMREYGLITTANEITTEGLVYLQSHSPRRAIILAAGVGMRMIPINRETSKGMLVVQGEVLVERVICQLREVGITDIYIVVGFMKEQYEYLMDKYGVELIVNAEYERKNNYYSLLLAKKYLSNCYIVPCDLWCKENPFSKYESYSWYMVSEAVSVNSDIQCNKKGELVRVKPEELGKQMLGIAFITAEIAGEIIQNLEYMDSMRRYEQCFWEDALYVQNKMCVYGKVIPQNMVFEINSYEQLRDVDPNSSQLDTEVLRIIANCFQVSVKDIRNIKTLKKGMTNRSFLFTCNEQKYIMRIPGEGTDLLINRQNEYQVYQAIKNEGLCEEVFYFDPNNGYKISQFIENGRNCDAENWNDVATVMKKLKAFHKNNLQVEHTFDLFERIEFYENLWNGQPSAYSDYQETKRNILELKKYIDSCSKDWSLTHIDAIADNFLLAENKIYLIDWEYAGMQDPHVDLAMFAIYSLYDREKVDRLIDIYFEGECSLVNRKKIYCYIAISGLLWSNWCEYKRQLGVEFGEYSLRQYRYAKDYYRLFMNLSNEVE